MEIVVGKLSDLELEILNDILQGKIEGTKKHEMAHPTVAHIAWVNSKGMIEMGPVRWGHHGNYHTNEGTFDSWDASPFPGAWTMVPLNRIVRVRHVNAW